MTELRLTGLGKHYGRVEALSNVELVAAAGTRTAIIGPSGSGKTTLLRLVAGFEMPDAGEILVDGVRIAAPDAAVPPYRRNIGLVMQEGALFPHLSVGENIAFGIAGGARERHARVKELLELVELDRDMANRHPHQLSGGQQQRVALARALARRPWLMLLDEPFSALDTELREQMRRITTNILERDGITTILVTHDQEEALGFGSQLVVLRGGRLVQCGPPAAIYAAPADVQTASFLGPAIILDADVRDGVALCGLGTLRLPSGQALPSGPARVMVRPEQIRLDAEMDPSGTAAVSGRVVSVTGVGASARVSISVRGSPFSAGEQVAEETISFRTSGNHVPPPGSIVSISIAGTAHCFPA